MISIKYLCVIVPVLVLLIGIIWSIIPISKKKVIKNTNIMFISTKATNKQEGNSETKKKNIETAKAAKKKAARDKKKAKATKKKAKKSKRKHKTE
jgi:hypothetical protein